MKNDRSGLDGGGKAEEHKTETKEEERTSSRVCSRFVSLLLVLFCLLVLLSVGPVTPLPLPLSIRIITPSQQSSSLLVKNVVSDELMHHLRVRQRRGVAQLLPRTRCGCVRDEVGIDGYTTSIYMYQYAHPA